MPQLWQWLTVWPWAHKLFFLCINCIICNMRWPLRSFLLKDSEELNGGDCVSKQGQRMSGFWSFLVPLQFSFNKKMAELDRNFHILLSPWVLFSGVDCSCFSGEICWHGSAKTGLGALSYPWRKIYGFLLHYYFIPCSSLSINYNFMQIYWVISSRSLNVIASYTEWNIALAYGLIQVVSYGDGVITLYPQAIIENWIAMHFTVVMNWTLCILFSIFFP